MHGFTFERKGEPVEIPDDHPHVAKFVNNHFFKTDAAPADAGEHDVALPNKGGRPRKTEA